jgi:hypothetical protein
MRSRGTMHARSHSGARSRIPASTAARHARLADFLTRAQKCPRVLGVTWISSGFASCNEAKDDEVVSPNALECA